MDEAKELKKQLIKSNRETEYYKNLYKDALAIISIADKKLFDERNRYRSLKESMQKILVKST